MIRFFLCFLMLGFFSFGGGYALLPLMENELVERLKWISPDQFLLALTAGQITPGPVAVAGTFAGFMIGFNFHHSILYACIYATLAWIATNLPTVVCMELIMRGYKKVIDHPVIPFIMQLVMPVVIGLIFCLAIKIGIIGMVSLPQCAIAMVAFILASTRKIDYAFIIISGGIIGYFFL